MLCKTHKLIQAVIASIILVGAVNVANAASAADMGCVVTEHLVAALNAGQSTYVGSTGIAFIDRINDVPTTPPYPGWSVGKGFAGSFGSGQDQLCKYMLGFEGQDYRILLKPKSPN